MARKKQWSRVVEESGIRLRLYERPGSSSVFYSIIAEDGRKLRKSLRTGDRRLAEDRARAIAQELAKIRYTGGPTTGLTLDRLRALYLHHRGPLLTKVRRRHMKLVLGLVVEHFGPEYLVDDFAQHALDSYVSARQRGTLRSADRRASKAPAAGTIRNELHSFSVICNWATEYRVRRSTGCGGGRSWPGIPSVSLRSPRSRTRAGRWSLRRGTRRSCPWRTKPTPEDVFASYSLSHGRPDVESMRSCISGPRTCS